MLYVVFFWNEMGVNGLDSDFKIMRGPGSPSSVYVTVICNACTCCMLYVVFHQTRVESNYYSPGPLPPSSLLLLPHQQH